jgi:hypothetical protein
MAAGHQHHLEFGGSPVGTEFPGKLHFDLIDRIPHIAVSHEFDEESARMVRYVLVATVGPERPFYHRYPWVVLDLRMISDWQPGAGEFIAALRERLRRIDGELFLVATTEIPVSREVPTFETVDEAVASAKAARARRRAAMLSGT